MAALKTIAEQRAKLAELLLAAEMIANSIEEREAAAKMKSKGIFRVYHSAGDTFQLAACNPATGHYKGYRHIVQFPRSEKDMADVVCERLNIWLAEYTAHRLSV